MNPGPTSSENAFIFALKSFAGPTGLLAVVAFGIAAILVLQIPKLRWPLLGCLLWAASLDFAARKTSFGYVPLASPAMQFATYGRPLTIALLVLLLIALRPGANSGSAGWMRTAPALFLAFELIIMLMLAFSGGLVKAALGFVVFPLIFLVLGRRLGQSISGLDDVHSCFRAFGVAGVLFAGLTTFQLLVNSSAIVAGNRLFAITANPNAAGIFISLVLPTCLYLLMQRHEPFYLRVLWGAVSALLALMLLWTGSRASALATMVAIITLVRFRVGRAITILMILLFFGLLSLLLLPDSLAGSARLLSSENTRKVVWGDLVQKFLASPLYGSPITEDGVYVQESSYLSAAAHFGLIGLIPLVLAVVVLLRDIFALQKIRAALGEHRMIADLVTGCLASLLVMSVFEATLLGMFTISVFALYIYMTLLARLLSPYEIGTDRVAVDVSRSEMLAY